MSKNIHNIHNWFLDMDGTIYIGENLIPGALSFLQTLRSRGDRVIFLTNNSSGSPASYVKKLARLNIPATENEVFTSGDAAATYLEKNFGKGAAGYVLGTPELEQLLTNRGFRLCGEQDMPAFVLLGFDRTLTYDKIRIACSFITKGVPFIATHPDLLCPAPGGSVPDTGSMIEMFAAATGVRPVVIGKPYSHMAEAAFAYYHIRKEETAMVGDRLYTDIAFGNNADIAAVLVLSGETTAEQAAAAEDVHPDFIFGSVKDIETALRAE